jgi:DNA phosphorothioation-associated putative methyltransferase
MSPLGKSIGRSAYLHVDTLEALEPPQRDAWERAVAQAEAAAGLNRGTHFNVIRLDSGEQVGLLNYPDFFDDPFPSLSESWRFDSATGNLGHRIYADSLNPPILHRKELLLPQDHPRRPEYEALTAAAEAIGLFDEPTRIGYRRQWESLVLEKGYRIEDHTLVPLGNAVCAEDDAPSPEQASLHAGWEAARQRTALVRYGFSAPVQSLARHGFLDGRYRLFDYGCGRGDDVRGLRENGLPASGWDPYYAPDEPREPADIVNLGFVVNVIEDFDERVEALTRAWTLSERLLVVSVMLANQNDPSGARFRDGILTKRGTFQRYYTQAEIKAFLEQVLDEEPIPVAPGVLYVFRNKEAEQRFLLDRYRSRCNRLREPSLKRPDRERGEAVPRQRRDVAKERYETYREPLNRLWDLWVGLGRRPDPAEVSDLPALTEGFGSLAKALQFIGERQDPRELASAQAGRIADLTVYLALNQFEHRRPYRHLEPGLQRDIKAFFGDYGAAEAAARELLFRIGNTEAIADACRTASERGLGWLEAGEALQLHTSLIEQLPPLLRIYIGCAAVLYGDLLGADLVKVHIGSGKVSLMRYEDFEGQALPRLVERVKIKLRKQDVDYFAYGEGTDYAPPYLFHKSRYVNEEFPGYPEQHGFENALDALGLFDLSGHGPDPETFDRILARHRWQVEGLKLVRSVTPPDIDDACGRFLTFRQLIECGETQARTGFENLPRQPESWTALQDLAERVLDPVIDWFGMIRVTYGFCSPELARKIPAHIDPKLDQHAAWERNRRGQPICPRLGAAADFLVEDEDMLEVARWVAANTPFDRLYFYGSELPIHVSFGPEHSRQVVTVLPGKSGRLIPNSVPLDRFLGR